MAVIKISEMTDAILLQDNDHIPILQNGLNKKVKVELLRDYDKLHNKPIINGVTVEHNKTITDYNVVKENQGIQINEDNKTLELETLGSIEIENRADVNKAITIKTADKTAKETAHQTMSKEYQPNDQTYLSEGENQPVSYKAVKEYVDTLEAKVDENERDIEAKHSALEEKVDTNESDIESKHTTLNNKVDENERDIEDKVQKLDEKTAAKDSELESLITTNEQDIEQKYTALNQKVEQNKQTADSEIQQLKFKDSELENLISTNEEDIESKVQELDNKKLNKEETPKKLPNPNKLTFTGAVSGEYDGSAHLSIEIPEGGGGSNIEIPLVKTVTLDGESVEVIELLSDISMYKHIIIKVKTVPDSTNQTSTYYKLVNSDLKVLTNNDKWGAPKTATTYTFGELINDGTAIVSILPSNMIVGAVYMYGALYKTSYGLDINRWTSLLLTTNDTSWKFAQGTTIEIFAR